jgi:hypothetical protein
MIVVTFECNPNCEECLALMAELAEAELQGKVIHVSLRLAQDHVALCTCCREEYDALLRVLCESDGRFMDGIVT